MCIAVDIVLLTMMVVSAFLGWRRGFVRSFMNFISFILAIIFSVIFVPKLTPVYQEKITPLISDAVSGQIDQISEEGGSVIFSEVVDRVAGVLGGYIDKIDLATDDVSDDGAADENELISSGELTEKKDDIVNRIADPISEKISYTLAFMTLFLGATVALKIITRILDSIFKLPLLKGINKSVGLLFGALIGLVWTYIAAVTLVAVFPLLTSAYPDVFSFDLSDSIIIGLINAFKI